MENKMIIQSIKKMKKQYFRLSKANIINKEL